MGFSTLLRHATTKPCALPCLPASSQFQVDPEGRSLPARRRAMTPRSHCSLNELYFLSQTRKSYRFSSVPEIQRATRNSCCWYFVFTRQCISHAYKCIACAWLFSTIPEHAEKVFLGEDLKARAFSSLLLGPYWAGPLAQCSLTCLKE